MVDFGDIGLDLAGPMGFELPGIRNPGSPCGSDSIVVF